MRTLNQRAHSAGVKRTASLFALATILAAVWTAAPATVARASVPGDSLGIVVSSGTLSNVTINSSPSGVSMQPSFSTSTKDYALRSCGSGSGFSLTFTLNGTSLQVGGQSGSSVTVPESMTAGQAVIVSTGSAQYWFRCLPSDFPPITIADHGSGPSAGWYATDVVAHNFNGMPVNNSSGKYAMILDSNGTPVWFSNIFGIDFQQLIGSIFSWGFFNLNNPPFDVWENDVQSLRQIGPASIPQNNAGGLPHAWSACPASSTSNTCLRADGHELLYMNNGDYMMISSPDTPDNVTFTDSAGTSHTGPIVDCVVEELNASGGLVWAWDAYYGNHINPSETFISGTAGSGSLGGLGTAPYDVYHCNSLEVDPANQNPQGAVLLSARNTDAVYKINRSTLGSRGPIAWKLGNDHATDSHQQNSADAQSASPYDNEPLLTTTYTTTENTIGGQHDARFMGGTNAISFYDDHSGWTGAARGIEFNNITTTPTAAATEVKEFDAPDTATPAGATGAFRPTGGGTGDSVVAWGFRNNLALSDFDSTTGTDLRDIYFANSATSSCAGAVDCYFTYRFLKLAPSAFDINQLHQTVGTPGCAIGWGGCRNGASGPGWKPPGELTFADQFGTHGVVASSTTSASPGSGWVDTFWKGADNNLWHAWTRDGGNTFFGPQPMPLPALGGPDAMVGNPQAVSSDAGRIDVFWHGADNGLWHEWFIQGQGWAGPGEIGGTTAPLAGDPSPAVYNATGIDVFWKNSSDGHLWHAWYLAGQGWKGPQSLGQGVLGSDPHAASPGTDRVNVFWKGSSDGNLWSAQHDDTNGWVGPLFLGSGPLNSDPHPISPAPGVVDVFWRGGDLGLWHTWFIDGQGWAFRQTIGGAGTVTDPPVPVSSFQHFVDVIWRSQNPSSGAMFADEARYIPGQGWTSVAQPAAVTPLTTDPSAAQAAPGEVGIFAGSLDGTFWFQTNTGTSSSPQ